VVVVARVRRAAEFLESILTALEDLESQAKALSMPEASWCEHLDLAVREELLVAYTNQGV
jgi:hypothetical protein